MTSDGGMACGTAGRGTAGEVFAAFFALGVSAFGGPVAHLGYFRTAFVARRRWLAEGEFADLVALCSVLPGPTSSQVGAAIGFRRAGWTGAAAAWTAFTLPSAALMTAAALAAGSLTGGIAAPAGHGLKLAAAAIVAQAVVAMARSLTPDWPRRGVALVAAAIVALGGPFGQLAAIAFGFAAGAVLAAPPDAVRPLPRPRLAGSLAAVAVLAAVFVGLPLLAAATGDRVTVLAAACVRAGALVFGGGHVVLPLLQASVVPRLVGSDAFLAAYGAVQAMPGPLFTFAAYLGGLVGGVGGAAVALVALFAPGMVLLAAALPLAALMTHGPVRRAVRGVNAAVVGLLAAALVSPVGTAAIGDARDLILAGLGLAALLGRVPPLAVVAALVAVQFA